MPIRFAEACKICQKPYLHGSASTCNRCLHQQEGKISHAHMPPRLRCDCGKWAIAVILVRVGLPEEGLSEERVPLCANCLEIEKKTQAMLDRLG